MMNNNFQQFFPQPQGNVYMVNSSNEVSNVPIGNGLSAIICLSENMLYLKTIQNGGPVVLAYKLGNVDAAPKEENSLEERVARLEKMMEKGGSKKIEWET